MMSMLIQRRGGRHGSVNVGGTNSHTFAKDGETSYFGQHPTWIFPSCTKGTPVADILDYSPSFPLVIDYFEEYGGITAEMKRERSLL